MIGLRFNIKERLSMYKDFHYSDKTVVRLSYLYNGNPIQVRRWLYLETALVSRLSYLYNGNPISEKTVFILNPVAFVNKHGRTLLYSTHEREIEINIFNHSMIFLLMSLNRGIWGGGGGDLSYSMNICLVCCHRSYLWKYNRVYVEWSISFNYNHTNDKRVKMSK